MRRLGIACATMVLVAAGLVASAGPAAASPTPTANTVALTATYGGYKQISNLAYHQCAFVANGSLNIYLVLYACIGDELDLWLAVPAGPSQVYYLVNQRSGYCLEVNNGSNVPGERVDAFYCNGSKAEQWSIGMPALNGQGYGLIQNMGSFQCLDTVGGASSRLMQWPCAGNAAQLWKFS